MEKKVKIIVTIGPSTCDEESLRKIKDKGVDFVRVNMSHSSIEYLKNAIRLAKKVDIPFIIDTEGSQVRTAELNTPTIELEDNQEIKIYNSEIIGDKEKLNLKPVSVVGQLEVGDLIHIDFDTAILRVSDTSTLSQGYITAKAITGGILGKNKAVIIDPVYNRKLTLPTLSDKDYQSIKIGIEEGIGHIAASFMRSGKAVEEVRSATQNTMKIISKIECVDALENLPEIIRKSDYLLIDRGDLSKEIPIEKIPFTQKIIINKAKKQGVGVFVATNLLETMVNNKKPTRAEVHDVINTIVDGAEGLALAAETAIGKYPMACINMLNSLIKHASIINVEEFGDKEEKFVEKLEKINYLLDFNMFSSLIPPHGGKLVDRIAKIMPEQQYLRSLPSIKLDENRQRDVEQIAIGTYSPLEGFMGQEDFNSVLDRMRLANGLVWPIPITFDVSEEKAAELSVGDKVALLDSHDEVMAILHLQEKYSYDKLETVKKLYSTYDLEHPGARVIMGMGPILLAGSITLLKRRKSELKEYELTPKQTRRLFEERGWSKVVGFHTRNVIHRSHEFIQLKAMEQEHCDGLFVHPVVGKKKTGDFNAQYIIKSYEMMIKEFYPKNKVLFGTFSTYSRYAGPREALFTALCRQNFGCSHFIVGRDHTGVGDFYHPKASHNIFNRFPELEIKPVRFDAVFYSEKNKKHLHEQEYPNHPEEDKISISGTQARKMFEAGEIPPSWFMRPEISQMILEAVKNKEEVFVREE
ncbi:MAG: sulfate adenylyltransferase [Nanoarchaeota archaeon]